MNDIHIIRSKNNEYIQELLSETYENSLQFEITHESDYDCNYLDLNIKTINNKLVTELYNQTVLNFTLLNSTLHFNPNISMKVKNKSYSQNR